MNALEQSIVDICKANGLNSISFTIMPAWPAELVTCYTHRRGKCGSHSAATFAEAAKGSLADLTATEDVEIADEAPVVL